ncbi:hypothetical protein MMC29_001519, partial [Sticta canariensis]|nr:hypothetical protein [Sticta canariensis]
MSHASSVVGHAQRQVHGLVQEFFVGCGDVLGLLPSLVGEVMPGNGPAVAVGNALGHGPIVFHLPQSLIDDVRSQAQSDVAFKQLELDLHRVASLFVLDRAKGQVRKAALAHYQHIALMRTRKALLKRIGALQQRRLGRPAKRWAMLALEPQATLQQRHQYFTGLQLTS